MYFTWFVHLTVFLVAIIIQIPIAVDRLRFLFPQWRISRMASRFVHTILFVCMGTVFCIIISYYLFVCLPLIAPDPLHSVKGWLHLTFALWLSINMIGNYYHVVSIYPGVDKSDQISNLKSKLKKHTIDSNYSIPESLSKQDKDLTSVGELRKHSRVVLKQTSLSKDGDNSKLKQLKRKRVTRGMDWQPREAHYCKICRCTISHLDHHCPLTGCCAGLENYSYFFIGLCYGTIGLLYAVLITMPYFFHCNLKNVLWFFGLIQNRSQYLECAELGPHTHIFLSVFLSFIMIGNILCYQFILILADVSTYNVLHNWDKYPMIKFIWHRICGRKFLQPNSRLNVLLLDQRPSLLWFLIPVRSHSSSQRHKRSTI